MKFGKDRNGVTKPRGRARFDLRGRLKIVAGGLGLCALALVARAVDLQLVDNAYYQQKADSRFLREIPIPTSRGMITDRNGEPLAVSSPVDTVWGNPQELLKSPARLPELAEALGVPLDELERKLAQRADKEFVYLQRRINPAAAEKILARKIPGVFSQREFRRFYPQGEALAHVLGFTNIDDLGQEGVELAFDDWLRGTPGAQKVIRDRRGRIVENVDLVRAAQPGKDLVLSIDRRIQYLAHRELRRALLETGASAGSVVVLDVATGEILAMANLPTFNPNAVTGEHRDARRNRAVTDLIEPGSTIKPLTVAAGLEAGVISVDTQFDTSPGWIPNGRYRTSDFRNYGVLDTTGVLTKSSNVGVARIVQRMPDKDFHAFLSRMGYGKSTGSGFPGEAAGLLPPPGGWSGTSKQTMSYGYGLSATPLQIAHSYATLGNHGRAMTPTLVKGQGGEAVQVLDSDIADQVVRMMQTVTEPGGTATRAAILGYHVAGKTGTARKASGGGYARRYVAFFAGLVPVDNPRFSMAVVIDDPDTTRGVYGGGAVSAPVFQRVMDGALRLMDVPPDDIDTWLAAQAKDQAKAQAANARRPGAVATVPAAAAPAVAAPAVATAATAGARP
ncbi:MULTISPECIES: penicillin-binding protein 2 [unclassified Luteimonas]|uniref:peptidoglycan D,D-transpeptidase FtsI family protein n=1 Tax=unclassified Luteimonas TaxID=2629088 RepID=UPI0015FF3C34|nr:MULTISPECIES: penicillin-binding protein 2 [unclassified Luteimonas]MBB1473755.1 penicillin-binding protein 2 [Luteimonas sp. MC1782]MBB6600030.1 penicillin-binding protein 2 [Luteimonas sp. MC1825]QOC87732.1 penicillin-binding protein 2 [Luteimonas sp. MC1825]